MVFVCVYFSVCPVHLSNFTAPPSDPREIYLEICCSDRISCCCRCYLSKHSTLEPRDFRGQVQQLNSQRPLAPAPCPSPLPQPLPLPLQLSLRGNEIMNDVILLPLRCFHSRGAHDMPRPYLICYIYIACEIGNWQLDLLLAGFWLPVKRYPHPSAQFPIQSCCRVCVISAGNERSRAIICRRLCRRAEAFRP